MACQTIVLICHSFDYTKFCCVCFGLYFNFTPKRLLFLFFCSIQSHRMRPPLCSNRRCPEVVFFKYSSVVFITKANVLISLEIRCYPHEIL